jgi:hypothetical protein
MSLTSWEAGENPARVHHCKCLEPQLKRPLGRTNPGKATRFSEAQVRRPVRRHASLNRLRDWKIDEHPLGIYIF